MTCNTATMRRLARKLPATPILSAVQSLLPKLKHAVAAEKAVEAFSASSPGFQTRLGSSLKSWDEVLDQLQKIACLPLTYPEEAPLQMAADLVHQTLELQDISDEATRDRSRTQLQMVSQATYGCSITNRRFAMSAHNMIVQLLTMREEIDALIFRSGFTVSMRRQAA